MDESRKTLLDFWVMDNMDTTAPEDVDAMIAHMETDILQMSDDTVLEELNKI